MSEPAPEPQDDPQSDEVANSVTVEKVQFTDTPATCPRPRAKAGGWRGVFIDALRERRGNVDKACVAANISRKTAYRLKADEPEFADAWEEVIEGLVDRVEETVMESGMSGDPEHAQFILKTRRRPVYGDKVGIEITGAVAHLHLQPEQLAAAAANALPWIQEARAKHLKGPKPGEP